MDAIGSEPLLVHLKALVVDDEDLSKQEEFYKVSFIAINQLVHDYADKRKMKEVTKLVDEVDSSIAALK